MDINIRHNPAFSVARCFLAPGEPMKIESGAMMAHSPGMQIEANTAGGIMQGLKRSILSGESFFVTTMTAPQQGGWTDLAGTLPGDIMPLEIQSDRPFYITRGCWLGNSWNVQTDTQWGGARNLIGGEGGFGLRVFGQGVVLLSVYGALDIIDLAPGEPLVVDTGHLVAYDLGIQFQLRKASAGGLWQSFKSGEGFVFEFMGPGRIYLQSRNPSAFASYIRAQAPSS